MLAVTPNNSTNLDRYIFLIGLCFIKHIQTAYSYKIYVNELN